MLLNLKKTIKNILQDRHPSLWVVLKRIYIILFINKFRKKINGDGNKIQYDNTILRNVIFDIKGHNNLICIKKNCIIEGLKFYIRGDNHKITIGADCHFDGGIVWIEDNGGSLNIGPGSTFGVVHLAITEPKSSIEIGADCMFAYDIDVRTGDSHSIIDVKSNQRINFAKNVLIGDHVWVAAHAVILKGVVVNDDSIIASGSIVTKSFHQKNIVIGGNPARCIKGGVNWTRCRVSLDTA